MAIAGKSADLYIANGTANVVTSQAMTAISVAAGAANGVTITTNQWFRPTTQARRAADPTVTPTVYYNGVAVAATDYTFDPAGGIVKFNTSPGALAVTIDYSYLTITQCGGGKEWNLNLEREVFDATKFGDTWKSKALGDLTADIGINNWWIDASMLNVLADIAYGPSSQKNPANRLFLSLYTNFSSNLRYECYGWMKSDGVKAALAALIEEEVSFQSEGTVNYCDW